MPEFDKYNLIKKNWKGIIKNNLLKVPNIILFYFGRKLITVNSIRPFCRFIKSNGMKDLIGVEIGVAEGTFSKMLLDNLPIKKLYLVDCYRSFEDHGTHNFASAYEIAKKKLKRYSDKIEFVIGLSESVADRIPNNLDFVYIDGNHSYDFVKNDIEKYYPKLKCGGIMGGHDFDQTVQDVINAVVEFVSKHELKLYVGWQDAEWWFNERKVDR